MKKQENIIIEYNGWVSVAKEDLKIDTMAFDGELTDFDTSKLSASEIVKMLNNGSVILTSFGKTYLNDTIDGEDNFSFDIED